MKKKLPLFFAAMLTAVGAWAQDLDMSKTPLTLEAIENGKIIFKNEAGGSVSYRINGMSYQTIKKESKVKIKVSKGDRVSFFGDNPTYYRGFYDFEKLLFVSNISCTSKCYIYGNIMSLVSSTHFENDTILSGIGAFYCLFSDNNKIVNHPTKKLVLPATTISVNCYAAMFRGCTGLTSAPILPATKLKDDCYSYMFAGCTQLIQAPELPAKKLVEDCYKEMFEGCSNLKSITCLLEDFSADSDYSLDPSTHNWLKGVSPSGTFIKASGVKWTTGESGIPSGWVVKEHK